VGYELHITRANHWLESEGQPIGREEWSTYVHEHAALVEAGWVEWADIGREPVYELTGRDEESPSLSWQNGRVTITGPEIDYLPDLIAIAADLRAHIVGDDDQRYTAEGPVR
jgi:hypothetical protein